MAFPYHARALVRYKPPPVVQGCLAFEKDDLITVLGMAHEDSDWLHGENGNGQGVFPSETVERLPAPLPQKELLAAREGAELAHSGPESEQIPGSFPDPSPEVTKVPDEAVQSDTAPVAGAEVSGGGVSDTGVTGGAADDASVRAIPASEKASPGDSFEIINEESDNASTKEVVGERVATEDPLPAGDPSPAENIALTKDSVSSKDTTAETTPAGAAVLGAAAFGTGALGADAALGAGASEPESESAHDTAHDAAHDTAQEPKPTVSFMQSEDTTVPATPVSDFDTDSVIAQAPGSVRSESNFGTSRGDSPVVTTRATTPTSEAVYSDVAQATPAVTAANISVAHAVNPEIWTDTNNLTPTLEHAPLNDTDSVLAIPPSSPGHGDLSKEPSLADIPTPSEVPIEQQAQVSGVPEDEASVAHVEHKETTLVAADEGPSSVAMTHVEATEGPVAGAKVDNVPEQSAPAQLSSPPNVMPSAPAADPVREPSPEKLSFKERLAQFNKPKAAAPPLPPTGQRPRTVRQFQAPPVTSEEGSKDTAASDAKASIQGRSLKERMAALQALQAERAAPPPQPSAETKPSKVAPEAFAAVAGSVGAPVAAAASSAETPPDQPRPSVPVPTVDVPPEDAASSSEPAEPTEENQDADDEAAKRQEITRRMANLGGFRLGMAPPPSLKTRRAPPPSQASGDTELPPKTPLEQTSFQGIEMPKIPRRAPPPVRSGSVVSPTTPATPLPVDAQPTMLASDPTEAPSAEAKPALAPIQTSPPSSEPPPIPPALVRAPTKQEEIPPPASTAPVASDESHDVSPSQFETLSKQTGAEAAEPEAGSDPVPEEESPEAEFERRQALARRIAAQGGQYIGLNPP